jgi:ABC-type enterochelin transport system permease subunit
MAYVAAISNAINRILIPSIIGVDAKYIDNDVVMVARINIVRIIYSYESRTQSVGFKVLCAPYTKLYRILISKYININRFILHLQNVSIMRQLQIRNGDPWKNDLLWSE